MSFYNLFDSMIPCQKIEFTKIQNFRMANDIDRTIFAFLIFHSV